MIIKKTTAPLQTRLQQEISQSVTGFTLLETRVQKEFFRSLTGFTLIELVMVIVTLSLLAIVATVKMPDMPKLRLDRAAQKVKSDIRYAQSLAVSSQQRTRIFFDATYDNYSLCINASDWVSLTNPLTKQSFDVQLNNKEFEGVDIVIVYFNGYNNALVFDRWGDPYSYEMSSGSTVSLGEPAVVVLRVSSGSMKIVTVEKSTGRVYLQ